MFAHPVGDEKLGVLGPAIGALGKLHLFLAQGLAMGGRRIDLVRRAIADVAVEDDQGRPALGRPKDRERILDPLEVIGIADPQHVPVIGEKAGRDILGEGDARVALDGDVVVVVDPAEIVEAEMPGQRGRLGADALHQAAVAAHRIDAVVEDLEARPVVARAQPLARDGHADAGGDPLAQRAGGRFYSRRPDDIPDVRAPCSPSCRKWRMSSNVTDGCPRRS